jgi:Mce-associated membrane protein
VTDADATSQVDTAEPVPDSDAEAEPEVEREARPPNRTLTRSLAVLAIVFFVTTVALGIVAASVYNSLHHERDDRDDVRRAASTFAGRLLTFDYRKPDELQKAVRAMSTDRFAREYDRAFPGLKELITAGQTRSDGSVTDVYLGDVDSNSATVIAVVNTKTTGKAGPRTGDFYMELDMAKASGRWKVDGFTNLNFSGGGTPTG